jgi:hypothetical protein
MKQELGYELNFAQVQERLRIEIAKIFNMKLTGL